MQFTNQDLNDVLCFPFKDKQWLSKLCLQGALLIFLCFFLVGIPLLNGFMVRILDQSIKNDPKLPEWSEWGSYWRLGWKSLVIHFVYTFPAILIWFTFVGGMLILSLISSVDKSLALLPLLFLPVVFLVYGFMFLYMLALQCIQAAYLPLVAEGAPISTAFALKTYIWPYVKANAGFILLGFLISYLAAIIATVGFFAFFIGYFFTLPYAIGVIAHMHGLIYRRSTVQYSPAPKV